jgi:hypothetical protein
MVEPAFDPNPISKVIVTSNFTNSVNTHSQDRSTPYDQVHEYGVAQGITITIRQDDQLSFIIIFDATFFARMPLLDKQARILHELSHVENEIVRFKAKGAKFFEKPVLKQQILMWNAWIIWQEYDAERHVAELIHKTAQSLDKNATVEFNYSIQFAKRAKEWLEGLDVFLQDAIRKFRLWQLDASQLFNAIGSRIGGILIMLAYSYALQRVSPGVKPNYCRSKPQMGTRGCFLMDGKRFSIAWKNVTRTERRFVKTS